MGLKETAIAGVMITELSHQGDERGSFTEAMRQSSYPATFVQSNHSRSASGVLRGLHYHTAQADLWYVVRGRAQVGLVDLRTRVARPATMSLVLEEQEPRTLYIPPGVAHGFLALTDVDLIYWVTREYDGTDEHGLAWDDPTAAIPWETNDPVLSARDRSNQPLLWDDIPQFS